MKNDEIRTNDFDLKSFSANGKFGFINEKAGIMVEAVYDDVGRFSDGVAAVGNRYLESNDLIVGNCGWIDHSGGIVIPMEHDYYIFDGDRIRGLEPSLNERIKVYRDFKAGYIDLNNNLLTPFVYDYDSGHFFSEEIAVVKLNKRSGAINRDGMCIIPCLFWDVSDEVGENKVLAQISWGEYVFFNLDGSVSLVVDKTYRDVKPFSSGRALVEADEGFGYIDPNGRLVNRKLFEAAGNFYNGVAIVKEGGKSGLVDPDMRFLVPCFYDEILRHTFVDDVYYQVKINGKTGIVDAEGRTIVPCHYDQIQYLGGLVSVMLKGKYGAFCIENNVDIPCEYDLITPLKGFNYFLAEVEGLFGIVDKKGRTVVDTRHAYDSSVLLELFNSIAPEELASLIDRLRIPVEKHKELLVHHWI